MTIKIKLGLAFSAVALVTLVIASTAWTLYDRLSQTFQFVTNDKVPAMIISLNLAKAGATLAESAPSLNKVNDESDLEREVNTYNNKVKQLQIALKNIYKIHPETTIVEEIISISDQLIDALGNIEKLVEQRLALATQRKTALEIFNFYQNSLANIALGQLKPMHFGPAKVNMLGMEKISVHTSSDIIRLTNHMNLLVMQAISQQSPLDIEYFQEEFSLLATELKNLSLSIKNNNGYSKLYQTVSQFINYGVKENNIFALRLAELDVRNEGEILVAISKTHAYKMEKQLTALVNTARADIEKVKQETFVTIQKSKHFIFSLSIISLSIAIIMGWIYVSRKLIQPIDIILEGVRRISTNQLSHRITIQTKDELGMLANAFNRMASRLQETITTLKQRTQAAEGAKLEAELANRTKSVFLANMSHELRTPLNGILGYAQVLSLDDTLTEEQKEGLYVIQNSGEHLLMLINDILDFSQLESEQASLFPMDLDFLSFLSKVAEKARVQAQQKSISFAYRPLSHLPAGVHADEKRLRQILMNLLSNAIKFTRQGGVVFKVGYHHHKIRFQIEDTGIGIPKDKLDSVFNPFQQGNDNYLTQKAEGTGIGLPLVKKIVDLMQGELHIKSEPERGCTVWVDLELPEVIGKIIKIDEIDTRTVIGYKRANEEHKITILVVDDKRENRLVLLKLLKPLGFYIIEANNGQEGLEQIKVVHPHLILTDLVMPIMDGFEFVRQVRRNFAFNHTPIIALSTSVFDTGRQKSLNLGCNDFAVKPFKTEELLELLQKHLKLEWVYEEEGLLFETDEAENIENLQSIEQEEAVEEAIEQCILTSKQAFILYDLSMKGDVKRIHANIEQLLLGQPTLEPLIEKIKIHLKDFDTDAICELIEKYVEF